MPDYRRGLGKGYCCCGCQRQRGLRHFGGNVILAPSAVGRPQQQVEEEGEHRKGQGERQGAAQRQRQAGPSRQVGV